MSAHPQRTLLDDISSKSAYLSPAIRQVAEYVLQNPEKTKTLTISGLSQEVGVAESTISRFVRELGIKGFSSFRLAISEAVLTSSRFEKTTDQVPYVYEGIIKGDSIETAIDKVRKNSLEAIENSFPYLNPEIIGAVVEKIAQSRSIYFVATGGSSVAAENALIRFVRAGKKCWLFRDPTLQLMTAAALDDQDLVIGISDSGTTAGVVHALNLAKQHGCHTVSITSTENSPITEFSDHVIYTAKPHAGTGLYGEAVTAKWGQLAAVDVLYAAFALLDYDKTINFLEETFLSGIQETRV